MSFQISKSLKRMIIFFLSILVVASGFLSLREMMAEKYKYIDKVKLDYRIFPKVENKVFLNNNDFLKTAYLKDDKLIVEKLIKYIQADFSLIMLSNSAEKMELELKTYLSLQSFYGEKREVLWSNIKQLSQKYLRGKNKIEYQALNKFNTREAKVILAKAYSQTEIAPESVYSFVWKIKGWVQKGEEKLLVQKEYKVSLPISQDIFKLDKVNFCESEDALKIPEKIRMYGQGNARIYIISGLTSLALLIFVLLMKTKKKRTEYERAKDFANKEYGERFAWLEGQIDLQYANIIRVRSIKDLAAIADEIRQPIFCHEEESYRKTEYYIFDSGRVYYYELLGKEDFDKNLKNSKRVVGI